MKFFLSLLIALLLGNIVVPEVNYCDHDTFKTMVRERDAVSPIRPIIRSSSSQRGKHLRSVFLFGHEKISFLVNSRTVLSSYYFNHSFCPSQREPHLMSTPPPFFS